MSGAERKLTRQVIISDYDRAMSLDMPDAVRQNIWQREWELETRLRGDGASEEYIQEALGSQRNVIVRDELSQYDLDHKVDLQLGGQDVASNLQWLDHSANRSVGAQVKIHKEKYNYDISENLLSLKPGSIIDVVALEGVR